MKRLVLAASVLLISAPLAAPAAEPFQQYPEKNFASYFTKIFPPNFPDVASIWHKSGKGWYRIQIDPNTGKVTEVKVLQSTRVKVLDDAAAVAILQWRAKPHTIDHAVIWFDFHGGLKSFTGSHIGS